MLQAIQAAAPADVEVIPCGCLGHCGSGPMVLVLPQHHWHSQVSPANSPRLVAKAIPAPAPQEPGLTTATGTATLQGLAAAGGGAILLILALGAYWVWLYP